ncbi:MAG: ABC transporter ATP-binding protein [Candidatus Nanopelagicales bacterium]
MSKGTWRLRASLSAKSGETVAVVGPNGSGKTSLLQALAGITPLADGFVTYSNDRWDDPPRGLLVRPDVRDAAICFQDARLFPHLSVLDNVAFPGRCSGRSRSESRERATEWIERFGLAGLAGRKPGQLSGGQARRVSLARTLATRASLLLLDEPTASLDGQATVEIRELLREVLSDRQGVAVVVSHDPRDVLGLADQIVVLEDGSVINSGTATQIAAQPGSAYVADLVGANLISGSASGGSFTAESGMAFAAPAQLNGSVLAAIPSRAVRVSVADSPGSAQTPGLIRWVATVEAVEHQWADVRIRLRGPIELLADIPLASFGSRRFEPGDRVSVEINEADVSIYPAADQPPNQP